MRSITTMAVTFTALAAAGSGCGTEVELGTFSKSEASMLLTAAQRELQKVHEIALIGAPYPQTYSYGCPSGTIDMRISTDRMMQPVALRHTFAGCTNEDGFTFGGGLNWIDIEPACDDESGLAFALGGMVEVTGAMEGFCYIETRENCGAFKTGHICGYAPGELVIGP
jgi:hypothetical protein